VLPLLRVPRIHPRSPSHARIRVSRTFVRTSWRICATNDVQKSHDARVRAATGGVNYRRTIDIAPVACTFPPPQPPPTSAPFQPFRGPRSRELAEKNGEIRFARNEY